MSILNSSNEKFLPEPDMAMWKEPAWLVAAWQQSLGPDGSIHWGWSFLP